ncbi:hypothetical protein B0H13DRAFT_1883590 [Mycena leptocephala]|nr:hypothetical protein B0H13DRAFT_1883590 [Mycena leptocephala]
MYFSSPHTCEHHLGTWQAPNPRPTIKMGLNHAFLRQLGPPGPTRKIISGTQSAASVPYQFFLACPVMTAQPGTVLPAHPQKPVSFFTGNIQCMYGNPTSREELLTWDARRRANQEGSMASVAMAEPFGEDSRPVATGFDPPVARPIAPLPRPNPNLNPAAGRAHAHAEAALALGCGDVLGEEVQHAQSQIEWARTELDMSTGTLERTRLRGALLAQLSFQELLFRTPGIPASAAVEGGSHVKCSVPLEFDDCFIGPARPVPLTTDCDHQSCSVCCQVKSHPISTFDLCIAQARAEEVSHFTFINFEEYNSYMKYLRYHPWPSQLHVHDRSMPFDLASRGMREKVENGGDEGLLEHT